MTTIAVRKYKDRIELAADSLCNDNSIAIMKNKIHKNPYFTFGHAGERNKALLLNDWLLDNPDKYKDCNIQKIFFHFREQLISWQMNIFDEKEESVELFLVSYQGIIYDVRLGSRSIEVDEVDDFMAIGSGREFALAAMECGGSPRDAVAVAIKYDIYSGGDIQEDLIYEDKTF